MQPARWENDWLLIGEDQNGDGIGEPVSEWKKPNVGKKYPVETPPTTDEFNSPRLGLRWQWHANPEALWSFPTAMGFLRMNPVILPKEIKNLWDAPNLLLQKMPAEEFTATTKLTFYQHFDGEKTGLIVMGRDYAHLTLEREGGQLFLKQTTCYGAENGEPEKVVKSMPISQNEMQLRVKVSKGGKCQFGYSLDGKKFTDIGEVFQAKEGKWIGAKVGIFCARSEHENDGGYADYDWFRIEK